MLQFEMKNTKLVKLQSPHLHRKNKLVKIVTKCFQEFSRNTSIHGFKYLGQSRGCTIEKAWWLIILGFCIYMCAILTIMTLKKREENPVFVSFQQQPMHIWDIPFPAITICPASSFKNTKYNFTSFWERFSQNNLTEREFKTFMDANMVCKNYHHFYKLLHHQPDEDSIKFLNENSLTIEDILEMCFFHKDHKSCIHLFSPVFSSGSLCYSLNMVNFYELIRNSTYFPESHFKNQKSQNWNIDDNYNKTMDYVYPLRIISQNDGLMIQLKLSDSRIEKMCHKTKTFKIIIHHPADLPTYTNRYILLSTNQNYKIWITADIITTSSNLNDYSPHKRGCFYSKERHLKFFKIYTQPNCRLECIANFTSNLCGCAPFYIPREKSTRICGYSDMLCMLQAKDQFSSLEMRQEIDAKNQTETCDCLPSCTSILYNSEVTPEQIPISGYNDTSYINVYMSFKDLTFITMERNELFSNADFWASCGGLLGLFTGFSVISLAEIVYFSSVKWICKLLKRKH